MEKMTEQFIKWFDDSKQKYLCEYNNFPLRFLELEKHLELAHNQKKNVLSIFC